MIPENICQTFSKIKLLAVSNTKGYLAARIHAINGKCSPNAVVHRKERGRPQKMELSNMKGWICLCNTPSMLTLARQVPVLITSDKHHKAIYRKFINLVHCFQALQCKMNAKCKKIKRVRCYETPPHHHNRFSGTTRVSQCQKRTSGLYSARED